MGRRKISRSADGLSNGATSSKLLIGSANILNHWRQGQNWQIGEGNGSNSNLIDNDDLVLESWHAR